MTWRRRGSPSRETIMSVDNLVVMVPFKKRYKKLSVYVCVCVCTCEGRSIPRPDEAIRPPGTVITGSWDPPYVMGDDGN